MKIWTKLRNPILVLFSSFLLFLSYPKISIWPLAWIALIPAILVIFSLKRTRHLIFYGFLMGFSLYIMILYWIVPTMEAADINLWLSIFSLILLSSILSVEFIVLFVFSSKFNRFPPLAFAFVFSSIWTLIEYTKINVTCFLPYFPWFSISYTQWNNPDILPYACYTGMYGISYILVFLQSTVAGLIYRSKKELHLIKLFFIFLIAVCINMAGKKLKPVEIISSQKISIAILQPSIDFYKKWNGAYQNWIEGRIEALIDSVKDVRLIIWPENALPGWIDDREIFQWLRQNIKKTGSYHIVGSVSGFNGKFVSAFLLNPQGEIIYEYHKRILVPFGEYVPFRKILGKYIEVIGNLGEFESGDFNQKLFKVDNFKIGPSICYESIFNYLFFEQSKKGADFFVNITNDGWYLNTSAPYQHLSAAVLRASENGKYLVRAANNGISAVISPYGKIEKKLDLNEYGILKAEIYKTKSKPFIFSNYCVVYLSLIIVLSFLLAKIFI